MLLLQQKHHIHLCGYKITHLKSHYRCILPGAWGIKFIYEHQKRKYTATKHLEWEYLRYIVKMFVFGLLLGGTNHKPIKLAQRIKYIRLLNRLNHSLKKLEMKYIHMIWYYIYWNSIDLRKILKGKLEILCKQIH